MVCVCISESLCCMPEALYINYTSIIFFLKKGKNKEKQRVCVWCGVVKETGGKEDKAKKGTQEKSTTTHLQGS